MSKTLLSGGCYTTRDWEESRQLVHVNLVGNHRAHNEIVGNAWQGVIVNVDDCCLMCVQLDRSFTAVLEASADNIVCRCHWQCWTPQFGGKLSASQPVTLSTIMTIWIKGQTWPIPTSKMKLRLWFDQRGFVITVLMTSCLQTECHWCLQDAKT